jgi:hypothetical protein
VRARLVERGWELEIITTLTNATDRPVRLGSPATNGRVRVRGKVVIRDSTRCLP